MAMTAASTFWLSHETDCSAGAVPFPLSPKSWPPAAMASWAIPHGLSPSEPMGHPTLPHHEFDGALGRECAVGVRVVHTCGVVCMRSESDARSDTTMYGSSPPFKAFPFPPMAYASS